MGIVVTNPGSSADGTDEDDLFIISDGGEGIELLDGKGGTDTLQMDYSAHVRLWFDANGLASAGTLSGTFTRADAFIPGDFQSMEILDIVGSPNADRFKLFLDDATIGSTISLDGGGGIDELTLDLTDVTRDMVIDALGGSIAMPFGTLANFETLTLYGGAGDDTIIGGNHDNVMAGGGGSNMMIGGSGRDEIRSTSITDYSDGGAGADDHWSGNFEDLGEDLSIEVDEQVRVNGVLAAENFESIVIKGGGGTNEIMVEDLPARSVHIDGSKPSYLPDPRTESLEIDLGAVNIPLRSYLDLGYPEAITGNVRVGDSSNSPRISFLSVESLHCTLGAADDYLRMLIADFDSSIDSVFIDGGAGHDRFLLSSHLAGSTFIVGAGRPTTIGLVTLTNFESFDLRGTQSSDNFRTLAGEDQLIGSGGHDRLVAGGGADLLDGGTGDDTLFGQGGADEIYGGDGNDYISAGLGNDNIDSGEGDDQIFAGGGDDVVVALGGNDKIFGGAGNDTLNAGQGNDLVNGQAGDDVIFSSFGTDLIVGGLGTDRFVFNNFYLSSQPSLTDRIKDFSQAEGDLIDFHYFDADRTVAGNQAFTWIGSNAFSGTAGELRAEIVGNTTFVYGDTHGGGTADFVLLLTGQIGLTEGDFVL
jgi:Ca2+-binding RTX toxin-like protein